MATQVTLNSGSIDSAGSLALKTNGTTTAVTINASQGVEFNAGTAALPSITTTGDTNTGIFFPAADTIAFSEGGVEAARFDSAGNFGLGVTPSAWGGAGQVALQIGTGTSGTANFAGGGTKTLISSNQYYDGSVNKYINNGYAQAMVLDTDSSFSWIQAASGTAGNTASLFTKMTLDASGNLGVGTSSPVGRLEAVGGTGAGFNGWFRTGDATAANNAGGGFYNTSSATAASRQAVMALDADGANLGGGDYFVIQKNGNSGTTDILQYSNASMRFGTNYTSRTTYDMTLDASGNLLVGNTSLEAEERLNVKRTSITTSALTLNVFNSAAISTSKAASALLRIASNASGADSGIQLTDSTTNNYYFGGNNGGAYVMANTNGVRLSNGGTSWASDSDERVKDIIEPILDAANKVLTLRAVIGKYKTDKDGTRRSFLIAQDVQAVLPEAVFDEQGTLMLAYTDTIPLLVAAIQEQQALITQLQADVAALKGTA